MSMHEEDCAFTNSVASVNEKVATPNCEPCLQLLLTDGVDEARTWVVLFQDHPFPEIGESTPGWPILSREAAYDTRLQLTTQEELIQEICETLLRAGVGRRQKGPNLIDEIVLIMPESTWQTAVAILRLARLRPDEWEALIQLELSAQLAAGVRSLPAPVPAEDEIDAPTSSLPDDRTVGVVESWKRHRDRLPSIPFFTRRIVSAWKRLVRQRRKQPEQLLRDGPVLDTNLRHPSGGCGLPCETHSLSIRPRAELPPLAQFTPAAKEKLNQMLALVTVEPSPAEPSPLDENVNVQNEQQFERIRALARDLARQKGSSLVHYRDVRRSAQILDSGLEHRNNPANPAEELPEHYDEVVDKLSALQSEQLRLSRGGGEPPKVLVIGEAGSPESPPFVARMFQDAGADVATCDLKESTAEGIPHFCGDAADIQDLGWDLVIGHPPCTFLSNASLKWLKNDAFRRRQMHQNAAIFRRFRDAQAPFVAIENSKMGPEARRIVGESPTQYIHPWQHGHGHTKPTALYLENLPPLLPTKVVYGRAHSLSQYPPDVFRTEKKSKTYMGIAAAMATQWMPVLQRYIQMPNRRRTTQSAEELVRLAGFPPRRVIRVALVDPNGHIRVLVQRKGNDMDLPERPLKNPARSGKVLKKLLAWLEVNPIWLKAAEQCYLDHPEGHRSFYELSDPDARFAGEGPRLCHLWVIPMPVENHGDGSGYPNRGVYRPDVDWIPIGRLQTPCDLENDELRARYRQTVLHYGTPGNQHNLASRATKVTGSVAAIQGVNSWRRPWLVDHEDLPPPPPMPKHIRRLYGKWRVWDVVNRQRDDENEEDDLLLDTRGWRTSDLQFEWKVLPSNLGHALDQHLGIPARPLPGTADTPSEEETDLGFWSNLVRVKAQSVLGTQGETDQLDQYCITDPAGLPFIQDSGPKGAGAASKAIYRTIGLSEEDHFPDSVKERVQTIGDAAYQPYGPYHVIHVVGPDLRGTSLARSLTRKARKGAIKALAKSYRNVLKEWLASGVSILRLLPISGGTFAGAYSEKMPQLTAEALVEALKRLSPEDKDELQFRARRARPDAPIQMCVFMGSRLVHFEMALRTALAEMDEQEQESGVGPADRYDACVVYDDGQKTETALDSVFASHRHIASELVGAALNETPLDLSTLRAVRWDRIQKDSAPTHQQDDVRTWWAQHNFQSDTEFAGRARELWAQNAGPKYEQRLGLGADPASQPRAKGTRKRRRAPTPLRTLPTIREAHAKFVPSGVNPTGEEAMTQAQVEADEGAHVAYADWVETHTRASDGNGGFLGNLGQDVAVVADSPSPEPDVAVTPSLDAYTSSLFVTDFRFRRREPPSTPDERPGEWLKAQALVPATKVLADTGAAPSVITTQMLEQLPKDCCIEREANAPVGPLNGANGKALVTFGTATIEFNLGSTPCRHRFVVIQGRPLVLLGNDFLVPRRAQIHLNSDGKGGGCVKLQSQDSEGGSLLHEFEVSTCPRSVAPVYAVTVGEDTAVPSDCPEEADEIGTPEIIAEPPPKPEDLVGELTADSEWKLENSEYLLYTTSPVVVPPRSRVTVRVRAPQALLENTKPITCLVDRIHDWEELSGTPGKATFASAPPVVTRLATITEGQVDVQLVNGTRTKISVAGFSPIAKLDVEYYVRGCLDLDKLEAEGAPSTETDGTVDAVARLSPTELELLDSISIDPEKRLSAEQLKRVRQMVARNIKAFATDPKNPTKTHLMEVELPLKPDAVPHRHAASRVGEEGRRVIEKHVEEMESRGIIRKSNSEWGSRVVLVTKKDGSVRFCVDYRDLNSKLQLQDSPIPLTMDALDRLSSGEGCPSSLFLSTLDLASGFWTLPVREKDKALTAFVTHRQKYEFNYLPFGIQSGPSYMVRLMDAALQGLAWESCMPYLDDIGVWSTGKGSTPEEREANSFEQMLTRIEAVFQRLRWAGLSMKASKCVLFATKAEYLGHVVSREGLRMDPKKIEIVKNFNPTEINTATKVRSFLGLCSYYRRFIEGFSIIAAPLTDLTRDGVDVETESQTPACQAAIARLIDAVTSEPVMCTPRFDRPFVVKTDAANQIGLGGVLSQANDEAREQVVAYHGRRLTKHERNYTVTEIELLAAVDCIRHWRPYLWGRAFKLVIDHQALRWLHTMRDTVEGGPSSRLMRWILKLAEYRFHVEHKQGALHKDADAISRLVGGGPAKEAAAPTTPPETSEDESGAADVAAVATARSVAREQQEPQGPESINASYLATGAPSLEQIRREQARDPECQELIRFLKGELDEVSCDEDLKRLARAARRTYSNRHNRRASKEPGGTNSTLVQRLVLEDDVLYRVVLTPDSTDEASAEKVPYVPPALRLPLMVAFHERMGHASRDRVAAALRRRFYWPNLTQDVADHVADCHECTLAKTPNVRNRHPVGPTVGRYPFDLIYADVLDMADTYDYDASTGAGYRKLAVFVDSLSRWAEAIPLHKEPTAAELLDVFQEYIVARHGVPRVVVSDRGSNLISNLNREIARLTGINLQGTAAEHHEANGIVERFNRTLLNMTRASNLGGAYWKDHLPFVLMAYRATPHRVTKESPAMLLYGREMRLPQQIGMPQDPPAAITCEDPSGEITAYATRLHNRLVYAWKAAHGATREAQGVTVSNTAATSQRGQREFQVGDRVVRKVYGNRNSLEPTFAGPYRVVEVMGGGRYKIRDLENKHTYDEFDISNLRLYTTPTEEEPLEPDEYIVERLLARRTVGGQKQYKVKYRGYAEKQSLWTSAEELSRRCQTMMDAYDKAHPESKRPRGRPKKAAAASSSSAEPIADEPAPPDPPEEPTSHLPEAAKFMRGRWHYGRKVRDRRSSRAKMVWKDDGHYTTDELNSELFLQLRQDADAEAQADPDVAAVFSQLTAAAVPMYGPNSDRARVEHDLALPAVPEESTDDCEVQVWFITREDVFTFECTDEQLGEIPRLTTFRGTMTPEDGGKPDQAARRVLTKGVKLPQSWDAAAQRQFALMSDGRDKYRIALPDRRYRWALIWYVQLSDTEAQEQPQFIHSETGNPEPPGPMWRSLGDVSSNLSNFSAYQGMIRSLNTHVLPMGRQLHLE